MLTIERDVNWKPFDVPNIDDSISLRELAKQQRALGFGNVAGKLEVVPNAVSKRAICNKLIDMGFDPVHFNYHPPRGQFIKHGRHTLPLFTETAGRSLPNTRGLEDYLWPEASIIKRNIAPTWSGARLNDDEFDWTTTPPEWVAVYFGNKPSSAQGIAIRMSTSKAIKIVKPALLKERPFTYYEMGGSSDEMLINRYPGAFNLIWKASLPLFPSTALELIKRFKNVEPNALFCLVYMPEWTYEQAPNLPRKDPIVLAYVRDEMDARAFNLGSLPEGLIVAGSVVRQWFKVCEWGNDNYERLSDGR